MARGRFISFEGGEGTGKSTQARRLADALAAQGYAVVLTREPGGTPIGEEVRRLVLAERPATPLTELLLFAAARVEHLAAVIRPALARGTWVVCDRYVDSTRVYQGVLAGIDRQLIAAVEQLTLGAEDLPALTFVMDLDPALGQVRAAERGALNRYDQGDIASHHAIRNGFLALAAGDPQRCVKIDAGRPVEAIQAQILAVVRQRLLGTLG